MFLAHWLRSLRAGIIARSNRRPRPRSDSPAWHGCPAMVQILESRTLLSGAPTNVIAELAGDVNGDFAVNRTAHKNAQSLCSLL